MYDLTWALSRHSLAGMVLCIPPTYANALSPDRKECVLRAPTYFCDHRLLARQGKPQLHTTTRKRGAEGIGNVGIVDVLLEEDRHI